MSGAEQAIVFCGRPYQAREGESVLECLRRHDVAISHSCRQGVCQSCVLKVTEGEVLSRFQAGLKPAWKAQGYVLACVTAARPGLALESVEAAPQVDARIERVERVSVSVACVWLRAAGLPDCNAGQFVQLSREDGLTRSYSVANLPHAGRLELHVAVRPGGRMSNWLANQAHSETPLKVRGPFGECFYVTGQPEQSLVLAGTGTGLSPLLGVVRAALHAGHTGPIWLYHGAGTASGLYLWQELCALVRAHSNLTIVGCVRDNDLDLPDVRLERIEESVRRDHPTLAGARVFLCGNPEMVRSMKKRAYLAGAALDSIHADPFVEADREAGR